ncbi:MAG TPA: RNA methyltransferase [Ktedonobacterales bacterium]|nr:RNA methyltransferase [Ktedonobacterales bacterium]
MISSPSNKHVQELHALHSLKGREAAGAFLIEGPHLLDAALDAHVSPRLILYDPAALERTVPGRRTLGRIEEAQAHGVEALEATGAAIERASDTRTPQGVVASVALADVAADKVRARRRGRARPLIVVLDAITDPGNLGTILRSSLAADADEVLIAPGCVDPLAPKVVRAGAGAHFYLPVRAGLNWDEISTWMHGAPSVRQILLADAAGTRPYDSFDMTVRTGIVICNEAHGASPEAARLSKLHVSIPMWNKVESLNAAVAASVILFEAARQRRVREAEKARTSDISNTSDGADERDDS